MVDLPLKVPNRDMLIWSGSTGTCTASETMTNTTGGAGGYGMPDGSYQLVSNASSIQICKVTVAIRNPTGSGVNGVYVQIADTSGNQIGGNSSSVNLPASEISFTDREFTWSTYPNPTADFRLVIKGGSDDVVVNNSSDDSAYGGSNYSYYTYGTDRNVDAVFTVYTIQ